MPRLLPEIKKWEGTTVIILRALAYFWCFDKKKRKHDKLTCVFQCLEESHLDRWKELIQEASSDLDLYNELQLSGWTRAFMDILKYGFTYLGLRYLCPRMWECCSLTKKWIHQLVFVLHSHLQIQLLVKLQGSLLPSPSWQEVRNMCNYDHINKWQIHLNDINI